MQALKSWAWFYSGQSFRQDIVNATFSFWFYKLILKEPSLISFILSSLGIFVYSELLHESFHPKIKEAIQVLTTALRFNNKAVAQIASDMPLLLTDHVKNFLDYYPEVPKKIVEVLARTLISLTPRGEAMISEDEKRLLLSLLFCLGEILWNKNPFEEKNKVTYVHVLFCLLVKIATYIFTIAVHVNINILRLFH